MDLLAGFKATIISGIFLTASLILLLTGRELPLDPAWFTVVISGLPFFTWRWAVWEAILP